MKHFQKLTDETLAPQVQKGLFLLVCQNNPNPQKGFQFLGPNQKSDDFLDFLDPSVQSFQPLSPVQPIKQIVHFLRGILCPHMHTVLSTYFFCARLQS